MADGTKGDWRRVDMETGRQGDRETGRQGDRKANDRETGRRVILCGGNKEDPSNLLNVGKGILYIFRHVTRQ